jgi:hypothetical protein
MPAAQLPALFHAGNQSRANTMGILRGTADTITVNATAKITDTEKAGHIHTLKYKVTFKARTLDDATAIIAQVNDPENPDVDAPSVVRDDLISWSDLDGEGGKVEYSPENLAIMLDHPEYRLSLFNAWGEAQLRRVLANSKN